MPISPGTHIVYTVRPGDSLFSIANQLGSSVSSIAQINALYPPITDPNLIHPGQVLLVKLPGMSQQSAVVYQVVSGDTLYRIAERYSVGVDMLAAMNQLQEPDVIRVAQQLFIPAFVYEVEPGDSLFLISRRLGLPLNELVRANRNRPGLSLDVIYPGFQLVVPLPSSTNVLVFHPLPAVKISSNQRLVGLARAFEAVVHYQILDATGRIVTPEKTVMTTEGAPEFGQFDVSLQLDKTPALQMGLLMVYTRSAKDGSIQDLVEVPVTF